jgi:hypothetical protein
MHSYMHSLKRDIMDQRMKDQDKIEVRDWPLDLFV